MAELLTLQKQWGYRNCRGERGRKQGGAAWVTLVFNALGQL